MSKTRNIKPNISLLKYIPSLLENISELTATDNLTESTAIGHPKSMKKHPECIWMLLSTQNVAIKENSAVLVSALLEELKYIEMKRLRSL